MILTSILNLLLIIYYKQSLVYLGADFFNYTWVEIRQTVGASGSMNLQTILLLFMPMLLIPLLFVLLKKRWTPRPVMVITFFILASSTFLLSFVVPTGVNRTSSGKPVNKLAYFIADCSKAAFSEEPDIDIYAAGYFEEESGNIETAAAFNYINEEEYPFLHRAETKDVLSPFFVKSDARPDIVLIIVEGLGRAYHNNDAYLGSFTPFLDSLSAHSLYWENFLSAGGRTFAVLPSVLGSLPFGKSGFLSIKQPAPRHLSLINILSNNGYKTSFYYGGDSKFDNMEPYLRSQKIDDIIDQEKFASAFEKQPSQNGFSWGFGDHELYSQYLEARDKKKERSPTLDVLLTLSTHSPFLSKDQKLFEDLVKHRINMSGSDTAQQQFNLKYVRQLATVMYSDHSLQVLFEKLRSDPRFKNSIYIITGDHRMPEIPMATKIDRYHVPLIIYSARLNRAARFPAISSHFDVAPSLLSFMTNNYDIHIPGQVSWIGSGLDTARYFRNIHDIPLMQAKGSAIEYVTGNYHISGDDLFKLPGSLKEEPVPDDAGKSQLQQRLFRFIRKNDQFARELKLYPDSILVNK
jgi:uncharacterized sulfatase